MDQSPKASVLSQDIKTRNQKREQAKKESYKVTFNVIIAADFIFTYNDNIFCIFTSELIFNVHSTFIVTENYYAYLLNF
jgi:hypothetical protein